MADESLFHYQRVGFQFDVFRNRVDIVDKSRFGAVFTGGKRESILLRTITGVTVNGALRRLAIETADGKTHEFNLGAQSEAARQALLTAL